MKDGSEDLIALATMILPCPCAKCSVGVLLYPIDVYETQFRVCKHCPFHGTKEGGLDGQVFVLQNDRLITSEGFDKEFDRLKGCWV